MEDVKHYRHEMKYSISYGDYLALRNRLRRIMKSDMHTSSDGLYHIRSIYFDNDEDKALKEKVDGIAKREKFRIRYYNDDLSFIVLEKKMKINNKCLKYDAVLTEEELRNILNNDLEWMKSSDDELIKEFYAKLKYQRLKPRVMVSYTREPYIYKAGNVRITFDSNIRTSLFQKDLIDQKINDIGATDTENSMIMEVKFDAFLPGIIQDLIQLKGIRQQAFSKYTACRTFG